MHAANLSTPPIFFLNSTNFGRKEVYLRNVNSVAFCSKFATFGKTYSANREVLPESCNSQVYAKTTCCERIIFFACYKDGRKIKQKIKILQMIEIYFFWLSEYKETPKISNL